MNYYLVPFSHLFYSTLVVRSWLIKTSIFYYQQGSDSWCVLKSLYEIADLLCLVQHVLREPV